MIGAASRTLEERPARTSSRTRKARLAILMACITASIAGKADTPPGVLVDIDSHRLHLHCTGQGSPVVVFESGLGGTSLDWSEIQPEISRTTKACSYDRGGYGWSEPGPTPRHARQLARELDHMLESAAIPPPYVLVGHSLGGLVVRTLAARKEQAATAAMVLVDATHEQQFQHLERTRRPLAPTGALFKLIAPHRTSPALPHDLKQLAQRLAAQPKAIIALRGELAAMRESAKQVARLHHTPQAPVAILVRSHDPSTLLERSWTALQRDLAESMPNATLRIVRDSRHDIHLEHPNIVIDTIERMLAVTIAQTQPTVNSP